MQNTALIFAKGVSGPRGVLRSRGATPKTRLHEPGLYGGKQKYKRRKTPGFRVSVLRRAGVGGGPVAGQGGLQHHIELPLTTC